MNILKGTKITVKASADGQYDLYNYFADYCELSERLILVKKIVNRKKDKIPADQIAILDVILRNADTCLDQCLFEDCKRHIEDAHKKAKAW